MVMRNSTTSSDSHIIHNSPRCRAHHSICDCADQEDVLQSWILLFTDTLLVGPSCTPDKACSNVPLAQWIICMYHAVGLHHRAQEMCHDNRILFNIVVECIQAIPSNDPETHNSCWKPGPSWFYHHRSDRRFLFCPRLTPSCGPTCFLRHHVQWSKRFENGKKLQRFHETAY
ncbi:unnamed protein product [Fusarium graminearum]|nr:unnamed protein product [Fusarium graminearum]